MPPYPKSFFWHDYETTGIDPRRDRPLQFAGVRTDAELNPIGEPVDLYCRLADDVLPHPEAVLVTGVTPQEANAKGLPEAEFIAGVNAELGRPGTCGAGYNSLRFDDEFTRNTLYRNFFDPYAREWQNGNSRWDLIDVVRMCRALRPEGIQWPDHEDGKPSFRLEHLTAANGLEHGHAHEALSDVYATIGVARLLKQRQPKLFDYALGLRDKREAARHLDLRGRKPVLHTSGMISTDYLCTALVVPLAAEPGNKNGIIACDLRFDPTPLLELDADGVRERLFTRAEDLPEGTERIPLKVIHLNRSPMVMTPKLLDDPAVARRLGIDVGRQLAHLERLQQADGLQVKLAEVFGGKRFAPEHDPDLMLYGGGFFSDADRARMERIRATAPEALGGVKLAFDDGRIPEMLFRYRARNWPESLSDEERAEWERYRLARLTETDGGASITLEQLHERIAELEAAEGRSARDLELLNQLSAYADELL